MRVAKKDSHSSWPRRAGALFGILGVGVLAFVFFLLAGAFAFFSATQTASRAGRRPSRLPRRRRGPRLEDVPSHPDLDGPARRITIFLSLYDVHLVRAYRGDVARADYRPGKFLPAYKPEAGEHNESQTLVLKAAGPTWS